MGIALLMGMSVCEVQVLGTMFIGVLIKRPESGSESGLALPAAAGVLKTYTHLQLRMQSSVLQCFAREMEPAATAPASSYEASPELEACGDSTLRHTETVVSCSNGVGNCHLQCGQLKRSREHSRCSCVACARTAI
jgi:hypothetical protein